MAKKTKKKAKKKVVKKASKKVAKKASGKKTPKKKSAKKATPGAPKVVSTGRGASAAEIGAALVAHVNGGAQDDTALWKKHFHKKWESFEGMPPEVAAGMAKKKGPPPTGMAWTGFKAVKAKCDEWMAMHTIHGCTATGPFVGPTGFTVLYDMDLEVKESGQRFQMKEVGVYTVKNGKVVREEFMYHGM